MQLTFSTIYKKYNEYINIFFTKIANNIFNIYTQSYKWNTYYIVSNIKYKLN